MYIDVSAPMVKNRSVERSRTPFAGRRISSSRKTCHQAIPTNLRWRERTCWRSQRFRFHFRPAAAAAAWRLICAAACGPWLVCSGTRSWSVVRTVRCRRRWRLCAEAWRTSVARTPSPAPLAVSPCTPSGTCRVYASYLQRTTTKPRFLPRDAL